MNNSNEVFSKSLPISLLQNFTNGSMKNIFQSIKINAYKSKIPNIKLINSIDLH